MKAQCGYGSSLVLSSILSGLSLYLWLCSCVAPWIWTTNDKGPVSAPSVAVSAWCAGYAFGNVARCRYSRGLKCPDWYAEPKCLMWSEAKPLVHEIDYDIAILLQTLTLCGLASAFLAFVTVYAANGLTLKDDASLAKRYLTTSLLANSVSLALSIATVICFSYWDYTNLLKAGQGVVFVAYQADVYPEGRVVLDGAAVALNGSSMTPHLSDASGSGATIALVAINAANVLSLISALIVEAKIRERLRLGRVANSWTRALAEELESARRLPSSPLAKPETTPGEPEAPAASSSLLSPAGEQPNLKQE